MPLRMPLRMHLPMPPGDPAVPGEQVVPLQGGQVAAEAADAATGEVALLSQKRKRKENRTPESKKRVFQSKIYNTCFQCYNNALDQILYFQAVPNDDCILPAEHMAAVKEVQEQRLRRTEQRLQNWKRCRKKEVQQQRLRRAEQRLRRTLAKLEAKEGNEGDGEDARTSMKGKAHGARGMVQQYRKKHEVMRQPRTVQFKEVIFRSELAEG